MLRLNRMTDYAILVLGALARRHGETLASGHLAQVTDLAQPTVAKVLKMLLAANLVETQRGVRGGYRLKKILAQISLVDIVEAMEGPIAVTDCIEGARQPCPASNCCCMRRHWNHVNLAIRKALTDVTLEDLINPAALFPLPDTPTLTEDDTRFASRQPA
ncbi:SUF system Fe-S cluster assembly regulator [Candidatus Puniceispirillum sp.]|nr:SUF system Fe-S cluster assembly regulator [Candidatus Puniceispirillum sp.]